MPEDSPDPARLTIERAFFARCASEGVVAPEDALKLLSAETLTIADDGAVSGLDAAITTLRETRPWLFRQQSSPGLQQLAPADADPAEGLRQRALGSGLTRDIQLWREARRR